MVKTALSWMQRNLDFHLPQAGDSRASSFSRAVSSIGAVNRDHCQGETTEEKAHMIHLLTPGSAGSASSRSGDHIRHLAGRRMMGIINLTTRFGQRRFGRPRFATRPE